MAALQRQRQAPNVPFNPIRCVVFLCSYALVLSDMMRTGVAIDRMPQYKDLEPSSRMFFGPYAYSDGHVMYNDSDAKTLPVWSYKFDTTSMGMRAVAQYLNVSSWSPCIFYKTQCEVDTVGYPTVLKMFDSLVEAVAQRKTSRIGELSSLTLRIKAAYFDRFHHFIFPFIFKYSKIRTVQAIHYDSMTLSSGTFQFCGRGRVRPYSCGDIWTNYRYSCQPSKTACVRKGLIWSHAQGRIKSLQARYARLQLDMLLLESMADFSSQGVSFQGRQSYDVVMITRIRNCSGISVSNSVGGRECETVAIDDYRYEGTMYTSNVVDWFYIIGTIRSIGQSYFWIRIFMLFLGCYHLRTAGVDNQAKDGFRRILFALRTMFTIPSQVVIYGSVFPITCYTVAHFLDCVVVYELVNEQFSTISGALKLKPRLFILIASVSMRSLWVLALALHIILYLRTRCCWAVSKRGIPGIPEFSISTIAMLTISGQYRRISFRDTRLLLIEEVALSTRVRIIRSIRRRFSRELLQLFFFSDIMDVKCLLASAITVVAGLLLVWALIRALSWLRLLRRCEFYIWPCTFASFAAGALWPANALMVSWNGFALVLSSGNPGATIQPVAAEKPDTDAFLGPRLRSILDSFTNSNDGTVHRAPKSVISLAERSAHVRATICLMNLAVMTDPVVFFRLRWLGGQQINVYGSKRNSAQIFFIPASVVYSDQDVQLNWSELVFLHTVNSMELKWDELILCG